MGRKTLLGTQRTPKGTHFWQNRKGPKPKRNFGEIDDERYQLDIADGSDEEEDHSDDEERYIIIGQSQQGRLLVVAYTERLQSIRLISARAAKRKEIEAYAEA